MKLYLTIFGKYSKCRFNLRTKQEKYYSINDKPSRWKFINKQWDYKTWYKNHKLHRETGPARIWNDGSFCYFLNGSCYHQNKQEWEQELLKIKEEESKL